MLVLAPDQPPEMFADEDVPEKTNMLAVDIYALGIIIWQVSDTIQRQK